MGYNYENQGAAYDPDAADHERQGRPSAPASPQQTMIERVARAIGRQDFARAAQDGWDALPEHVKQDHRRFARAAIEAMREPTDAMLGAAYETAGYADGGGREPIEAEEAWRAMIGVALGDAS
jgi:hypothetical protein